MLNFLPSTAYTCGFWKSRIQFGVGECVCVLPEFDLQAPGSDCYKTVDPMWQSSFVTTAGQRTHVYMRKCNLTYERPSSAPEGTSPTTCTCAALNASCRVSRVRVDSGPQRYIGIDHDATRHLRSCCRQGRTRCTSSRDTTLSPTTQFRSSFLESSSLQQGHPGEAGVLCFAQRSSAGPSLEEGRQRVEQGH